MKLNSIHNFKYYDLDMIREKYGNPTISKALEKADEELYLIYRNCILLV